MPKGESGWFVWGVRTILVFGVAYGVYLNKNSTSKERFEDYVKAHETWSREVLQGLRGDLADIKFSVRRIEDRLDRKGIGNSFIPGFPWYNFGSTNLGGRVVHGRR